MRLFLARRGDLPLAASRFLDSAVQQIFLRRVGSGYIFVHRLVLEYFARDAERRLDIPLRTAGREVEGPSSHLPS